jgi:hypothetical protein
MPNISRPLERPRIRSTVICTPTQPTSSLLLQDILLARILDLVAKIKSDPWKTINIDLEPSRAVGIEGPRGTGAFVDSFVAAVTEGKVESKRCMQ